MTGLEFRVPTELRKVLAAAPKAEVLWRGLTPIARRDFVTWIESAKQAETRTRRLKSVPSRLMSGKRRPCCYALVPMNLYKALGANPKAKLQWKGLTSTERRNFVSWIDSATNSETRGVRIAKIPMLLVAGKHRP